MSTKQTSEETIEQFERMIYLPLLLTILDKDAKKLETMDVKFKSPYLDVIKRAMDNVHKDLSKTNIYARNNRLKLIEEGHDDFKTSYLFIDNSNQYRRDYMNVRLRNRSQELLEIYLKGKSPEIFNAAKLYRKATTHKE